MVHLKHCDHPGLEFGEAQAKLGAKNKKNLKTISFKAIIRGKRKNSHSAEAGSK
jgi:hypothetical protein